MKFPTIEVRGLALGAGANARVIVPLVAATAADAAAQAKELQAGDMAELRLDALLPRCDAAALCAAAAAVRTALDTRKPLLGTIRTKREGGPADITPEAYADCCVALCQSGALDLIDVELSAGAAATARIAAAARAAGVRTVYSCHDFAATPPVEAMVETLCRMAAQGADIAKLAVMPHTAADTAALLLATATAAEKLPATPLITMAMGQTGAVSRVCGAAFGSCATFGTAGQASAPGQPEAAALRTALDAVQACV